jgi:PleD family two-component response regulator
MARIGVRTPGAERNPIRSNTYPLPARAVCRANHCELAVPHIPKTPKNCERPRRQTGRSKLATQSSVLRILIVVSTERRHEIARQLGSLHPQLVFVGHSGETSQPIGEDDIFQVALLPATLSDTDWWELWGVLGLLNRRPAILVYAREATFQLWSGVLESGAYDLLVEPFSDEELQGAVLRAANSFDERNPNGVATEHP